VKGLQDAGGGKITAGVQGTEFYHVNICLHDGGKWSDASCTCPDGGRTNGRCKHVGAVLLKAAEGRAASEPAAARKVTKEHHADTIIILNDHDPPSAQPSSTKAPIPDAAAACKAPKEPAMHPSPAPLSATMSTNKEKKVRQLPNWMAGHLPSKPAPGDLATAKAAALVAKIPPKKRNVDASALDVDKSDQEPAPKQKAPRKGKTPGGKAKSGGSTGTRQPAPTGVEDVMTDAFGWLEKLVSSDVDEQPSASKDVPAATALDTPSSVKSPLARGGEIPLKAPLSTKGKEAVADDSRRSLSRQSSSVPDTPQRSPPGSLSLDDKKELGDGSLLAPGPAPVTCGDSDDDSDGEDPAVRWARRLQEKIAKKMAASQQNSAPQAIASAAPAQPLATSPSDVDDRSARSRASDRPCRGTIEIHDESSDDDRPILQTIHESVASARNQDLSRKVGGKEWCERESSPEARYASSRSHRRSPSPPLRMTMGLRKPVVSLEDRIKALRRF